MLAGAPIAQVAITVEDVARSVAFYRDVLGLPLLFEVPPQRLAFLDAGGVRLYLQEGGDPAHRSRPILYYRVADATKAHDDAVGRGATSLSAPHVVHRAEDHDLWMAFIADPDGIPVGLMAEVPRA